MAFGGNWNWNSSKKSTDKDTHEDDDDRYRIVEDASRPGQYVDGFGNHYDSNYNRID